MGKKNCSMCLVECEYREDLKRGKINNKRGRPKKSKKPQSKPKKGQINILSEITPEELEDSPIDLEEIEVILEEGVLKVEDEIITVDEGVVQPEVSDYEPKKRGRKKILTFKCWFCPGTFDSNKEVIAHYEKDHTKTKVYRCNNCECVYLEYDTLKKHGPCANLKPDAAPGGNLVINNVLLFSTVLLHSVLPPGDYRAKSTILECEDCGCLLWSKADLKLHIDERHLEKSLRCHLCTKEFTTLRQAQRHKARCDGTAESLFDCTHCGLDFLSRMALNKHILSQHAGAKASYAFQDTTKTPNPDQPMYPCEECNASFSRLELLTGHINYEHRTSYECQVCHRKFTRIYNLWSHARVHDKTLALKLLNEPRPKQCLCNFCGQGFTNTSNLIVHVRRHTGEKPYKCDFCDKAYPRSYDLAVHRRTHTGERPCTCPVCGKSFSRSNKLTRHMHIHTGHKPFKCDYCDKGFVQSNDLRVHLRRHTGDKPYCCEVCGDRFINRSTLQSHRRSQGHHPLPTSVHPPSGYMPQKDSPGPSPGLSPASTFVFKQV